MGIQVLQRYDTSVPNPYEGLGKDITESIKFARELSHKKAMLDYDLEKLKIDKQSAQTEEAKQKVASLESLYKRRNAMVDTAIQVATRKTSAGTTYIDQKAFAENMLNMLSMDPEVAATFSDIQGTLQQPPTPSPEFRKTEAEIGKIGAETEQMRRAGVMMEQWFPGLTQGGDVSLRGAATEQGVLPPTELAPGMAATPTPAGRSAAFGGNMIMPEMTIDPLSGRMSAKIVNPAVQNQLERQSALVREQAKTEAELAPIRNQYNKMKGAFYGMIDEMGGLGNTALSARVKGGIADIQAEIGTMPYTQAFKRFLKPFGLSLASRLNRGRPTDKDYEAAAAVLFNNKYPMATNLLLMDYIDAALTAGDEGTLGIMFDSLFPEAATKNAQGEVTNKTGIFGRGSTAHETFKKRVKSMAASDTEFLRRAMDEKGLSREQAEEALYKLKAQQGHVF